MVDHVADELVIAPCSLIKGDVEFNAPSSPDKSFTHRAIMLASMACGRSKIVDPLLGDDCLATRAAFEMLGVKFSEEQDAAGRAVWVIDSNGAQSWRSPKAPINLGNSGTSARLLTGLFAGVPHLTVELAGDASLEKRPMGRVVQPLRSMGAEISGPTDGESLKLTITGHQLSARSLRIAVPSAQIKSALLLAAAAASGQTVIDLPSGGRDHTEKMLQALDATIAKKSYLGREVISLVGPWRPQPFVCEVPADPSSVAFFAALAALHPGLRVKASNVMTNATRIEFFKILGRMGLEIQWSSPRGIRPSKDPWYLGEDVADVSFYRPRGVKLSAVVVQSDSSALMLDEIPALAVVCALAEGRSVIHGLQELKFKESDRLTLTLDLLTRSGVQARAVSESLEITGTETPAAFSFSSDDHRMVMSAMILATRASKASNIHGLRWIQTSFPLFLEAFQNIKSSLS